MTDKNLKPLELLENDGILIGEVNFKPNRAIIIAFIAALALILTRHPLAIVLAAFILGIALYVHYNVKDRKTVGVYDNYLIVYGSENPELARRIDFEDIVEWECKTNQNGADAVMLKLNDEEVIYKDTFQLPLAAKLLRKALPAKDSRKIKEEKNKNKKLKFDNPFKRFKK